MVAGLALWKRAVAAQAGAVAAKVGCAAKAIRAACRNVRFRVVHAWWWQTSSPTRVVSRAATGECARIVCGSAVAAVQILQLPTVGVAGKVAVMARAKAVKSLALAKLDATTVATGMHAGVALCCWSNCRMTTAEKATPGAMTGATSCGSRAAAGAALAAVNGLMA